MTGTHQVLVSITTTCSNNANDSGCLMSFSATGGLSQSASDNYAIGNERSAGPASDNRIVGSGASFLLTITGNTTFTGQFRRGKGGTAIFHSSHIVVQVF